MDACDLAQETQTEVEHPLLDKVRQCSAFPDQAALFFQKILNPIPHMRVEALQDAWCASAVSRMFTETGSSYTPVVSYVQPDVQPDTPVVSYVEPQMQPEADKHGRCASLLSWVCCCNMQTIPDSDSSASDSAEVAPDSRVCCRNAPSKPVPPKQQSCVNRARNAVCGLFSRRKHQASGAKPAAAELPVADRIKSAAVLSMTAASESGKVALLQQQPSQDRLGNHGVIKIKQHDALVVDQAADLQHDAAPAQAHQVDADGSDSQPADSKPNK